MSNREGSCPRGSPEDGGGAMFESREDAAHQLAERLCGREFRNTLVLAIPRGGVAIGEILAQALHANLDVILSSKLRAPQNPQHVIGAVCEDRTYVLEGDPERIPGLTQADLDEHCRCQFREIERLKSVFRQNRPPIPIRGRSVI